MVDICAQPMKNKDTHASTTMVPISDWSIQIQSHDQNTTTANISTTTSHDNNQNIPTNPHSYTWFEYALLIVCSIGILGNCLNLFVLTRRRFRTALNNLECSANYGLVALAVSDFCYCVIVLPHAAFPGISGHIPEHRNLWIMVYKSYGIGFINLFQMTSTWIIVIIAINRWIVVKYPLRAKHMIDKRVTLSSILIMCSICAILTVPYFMFRQIVRCGPVYRAIVPWDDSFIHSLKVYLRWVWPVLANFIPLVLLIWCNVRLVIEVRRAIQHGGDFGVGRRLSSHKTVESKVTSTLLAIVVMYFLLVIPAEIIRYVNPYAWWGKAGIQVAQALNLLQSVNFAFNFLLYCAVNQSFRQTFREMIRPRRRIPSFRTNDDIKTLQTLINQRLMQRQGSTMTRQSSRNLNDTMV